MHRGTGVRFALAALWAALLLIGTAEARAAFTEQARLVPASGQGPQDFFGFSVALSEDGATALVGSNQASCAGGASCGAAYVYTLAGGVWSQQAKLTPADLQADDGFGASVALSASGDVALIGSPGDDCAPIQFDCGAAYVFVRSGGVWTERAKLTATDIQSFRYLGGSVALSADGTLALVGAPSANCPAGFVLECGAAYVFVASGATWAQEARLSASDAGLFDRLGASVALSDDGSTALAGAPFEPAAYVFVRSGGTWSEQRKLTDPSSATGSELGRGVALSGNGDVALVGAPVSTGACPLCGAAYVFTRSGTTWVQEAKLVEPVVSQNSFFGFSAALSDAGDLALVGAPSPLLSGAVVPGRAYVFGRFNGAWSPDQTLVSSGSRIPDGFGFSSSLSADGRTALVGAPSEVCRPGFPCGAGAAYVFADLSVIDVPAAGAGGLLVLFLLTAAAGALLLRRFVP